MYGDNSLSDAKRFLKAFVTNQVARFAPKLYLRMTSQTGRGGAPETSEQIAGYFRSSFLEYFSHLGIPEKSVAEFLQNKQILEYGPGDLPVVALLFYAYGAERVYCVDRFPMLVLSEKNLEVIHLVMGALESCALKKVKTAFNREGDPSSGFREEAVCYLVSKDGLSKLQNKVDIIVSRAVLEHVNDLNSSFYDMFYALKPGGKMVHKVDLKSHGLHAENPLDFLSWPESLWQLMYSEKGVPNRWRIDRYRKILKEVEFDVESLAAAEVADAADVAGVQPFLANHLKDISDEDLRWLSFWLIANKTS